MLYSIQKPYNTENKSVSYFLKTGFFLLHLFAEQLLMENLFSTLFLFCSVYRESLSFLAYLRLSHSFQVSLYGYDIIYINPWLIDICAVSKNLTVEVTLAIYSCMHLLSLCATTCLQVCIWENIWWLLSLCLWRLWTIPQHKQERGEENEKQETFWPQEMEAHPLSWSENKAEASKCQPCYFLLQGLGRAAVPIFTFAGNLGAESVPSGAASRAIWASERRSRWQMLQLNQPVQSLGKMDKHPGQSNCTQEGSFLKVASHWAAGYRR